MCGYFTSDNEWDVLIVALRKILNSFSVRQSIVRGKSTALVLLHFLF